MKFRLLHQQLTFWLKSAENSERLEREEYLESKKAQNMSLKIGIGANLNILPFHHS